MALKKSLLAILVIAAFFTRAWKLSSSPAGLYIDETSIGYNAYSMVRTGFDEHGKKFPLFFEAFGEYKLPIYIYSVALVQLFTGPQDISVRIPSLVFGIFSIPIIYLLVREMLASNKNETLKTYAPFFSSFLIAFSPWEFQFTRPGFEASAGLFFLLAGLYVFYKAVNKKSGKWLLLSAVAFVLTFYSYNSARIVTPIISVTLFVLYLKNFQIKSWILTFTTGTILLLPFAAFSFSGAGLVRAQQVSIFYNTTQYPKFAQFIHNYWQNISPVYLFKSGDPTIAHLTPYRMSLLHLIEVPFVILGFFYLPRFFSRKSFVILLLTFAGFIPSAISTLNPHALRAIFALPGLVIVSSFGFSYFLSFISKDKFKIISSTVFSFIIIFSFINFLKIYHFKYPLNAWWDWQVDIKEMTLKVKTLERNYDKVYFTGDIPRVSLLWYLKVDPKLYQMSDKTNVGLYNFNYENAGNVNIGEKSLIISRNAVYGNFKDYVYYPDGTIAFVISEI